MKNITILQIIITGIVVFLLLCGCDISSITGAATAKCPITCDDVSRVEEVTQVLNPEPDNSAARTINIIKFKNTLYAIYLNYKSQWFQVYVSKHGCGDEWTRTNGEKPLNINPKGIKRATNCDVRLIEYNNKLYAIWQESYVGGTVLHVKCYNEGSDIWESVDGHEGLGLSGYYFSNPNLQHWAYFYYAGTVVYNNELYVAWPNSFSTTGNMAILKYDGNDWVKFPGVQVPGRETWAHQWITLTVYNNKLHLAGVAKRLEPTPSGQDDRRTYLEAYVFDDDLKQWTQISNQINLNILDQASSPSLINVNDTLYITWREITSSNPDYSALPYKIYVKEYIGGETWDFTGDNPFVSGNTFKPTLLNYKNTLTLLYGNNYKAFIKQFNGSVWLNFPDDDPVMEKISMQGQGKFPQLDVFSAIVADEKIYFAWRPRTDPDHYLCGYIDDNS